MVLVDVAGNHRMTGRRTKTEPEKKEKKKDSGRAAEGDVAGRHPVRVPRQRVGLVDPLASDINSEHCPG